MEIKNMTGRDTKTQYTEIMEALKNLPKEDRILLSLYLYEGLTGEQVDTVMNQRSGALRAENYTKKSFFRNQFKAF
jgi:DNA-directed RNA polymerase specialized sigma24 family protein